MKDIPVFPLDIEELPDHIYSRVKNWDWLIPTIEDAIKYSGDADEENDEEIDWIEVFDNAEAILKDKNY